MSESPATRYLPVQVAGQNYLITMDIVSAVQPISAVTVASTTPTVASVTPEALRPDQDAEITVPMIELGVLLGETTQPSTPQYAIVVITTAGGCALLVDAIHAPINVLPENVRKLPFLLTLTDCPIKAIISREENLHAVLDVTRLIEYLRQASPDLAWR